MVCTFLASTFVHIPHSCFVTQAHFEVMPHLMNLTLEGLKIENTGNPKVVNWLAAETSQVCRNAQIVKPFIYADLSKGWLPHWCDQHSGELEADKPSRDALAIAEALGAKKAQTKSLCAAHWSIAFDAYAVASAAIGSWSYAAAMNHKVLLLCFVVALSTFICILYRRCARDRPRSPTAKRFLALRRWSSATTNAQGSPS